MAFPNGIFFGIYWGIQCDIHGYSGRKDNYEHYINQKRQNWNETKDEQNRKKREFAKNNPDIIKQRSQDNYEKFKDKLLERHLCGCGKYYTQCHKKRHEQNKKTSRLAKATRAGIIDIIILLYHLFYNG